MIQAWLTQTILQKKYLRSDVVWTTRALYRSFFRVVPLMLDTWALMRSQFWSRELLELYQKERIREMLTHAQGIPYWREVLASVPEPLSSDAAFESLSRIPITDKRALNVKTLDEIARTDLLVKSDHDHTSGSTGKPFHFYQDWGASLRSCGVTERIFRTATRKRYPIVYMRARERYGFTFYKHIWFFLRGYNSIRYRIDEFVELGTRLKKGFILYGYSSWVVELARIMEKRAVSLPLKAVMVAGEHISDDDVALIERVTKTKLFSFYASRELGFLGYECELRRMHMSEEWAFFEVVDERGNRVPDGTEGRLIVTTFDNRVMPFIRYEIGDLAIISPEACPCGRTLRTLSFRGRVAEVIELADGRTVTLLDIAYAIGTYRDTIAQYQIIQKAPLSFTFKIVPGPRFEQSRPNIDGLMRRLLHPHVHIVWEFTDQIPEATSGKAQYFIKENFSATHSESS